MIGRLLDAVHRARPPAGRRRSSPVSSSSSKPRRALPSVRIFTISSPMRSAAMSGSVGAAATIAARVAGSIAESEARGEADRAQHAETILGDARRRVADGADHARAQVGDAPRRSRWISPVSGSSNSALIVKSRRQASSCARAEVHGARTAAVDVGVVGAERRHLEARAALDDQDDAELRADRDGARKETPAPPRAARWSRRRSPAARDRAAGRGRSRRRGTPRGRRRAAAARRQWRAASGPSSEYVNSTFTACDVPWSPQAMNASCQRSREKRCVRMGVTSMRRWRTRSR